MRPGVSTECDETLWLPEQGSRRGGIRKPPGRGDVKSQGLHRPQECDSRSCGGRGKGEMCSPQSPDTAGRADSGKAVLQEEGRSDGPKSALLGVSALTKHLVIKSCRLGFLNGMKSVPSVPAQLDQLSPL